jgi:hypothetical protein
MAEAASFEENEAANVTARAQNFALTKSKILIQKMGNSSFEHEAQLSHHIRKHRQLGSQRARVAYSGQHSPASP